MFKNRATVFIASFAVVRADEAPKEIIVRADDAPEEKKDDKNSTVEDAMTTACAAATTATTVADWFDNALGLDNIPPAEEVKTECNKFKDVLVEAKPIATAQCIFSSTKALVKVWTDKDFLKVVEAKFTSIKACKDVSTNFNDGKIVAGITSIVGCVKEAAEATTDMASMVETFVTTQKDKIDDKFEQCFEMNNTSIPKIMAAIEEIIKVAEVLFNIVMKVINVVMKFLGSRRLLSESQRLHLAEARRLDASIGDAVSFLKAGPEFAQTQMNAVVKGKTGKSIPGSNATVLLAITAMMALLF